MSRVLICGVFLLAATVAFAQTGDISGLPENGTEEQDDVNSVEQDDEQEQEQVTAQEQVDAPVEPEPVIEQAPAEVFIPSEEISEDKPVPFPVDI